MSTQFSFGRLCGAITAAIAEGVSRALASFREWRDERRRNKQRRDVIAKHTKKGVPPPEIKTSPLSPSLGLDDAMAELPATPARKKLEPEPGALPAPAYGSAKSFPPARPPKVNMPAPLSLS